MALVSRSTIKGSALNGRIWVWVLLSIVLIFELTRLGNDEVSSADSGLAVSLTQTYSDENIYGLTPPKGKAIALPSIRTGDQNTVKAGGLYGGIGDKQHLGGFTDLDHHGVSPGAWKWMVKYVGVHSVLDVGCGRGISTSWFYFHGVDVLCVEGSHDAVERTVLPDKNLVVEHDFSRGPWWPEKTYDAVWCVEFLEHVGRNYQKNYLTAFRKSALIFASHSIWGGHHHVEVHDEVFWIEKMTMFGFIYSPKLTALIRAAAMDERFKDVAPNGIKLNAQHIWTSIKVFINPAVAALPQHAHLMAEPGCFDPEPNEGGTTHRECGSHSNVIDYKLETVLPENFRALNLTAAQDQMWFEHVKGKVNQVANPDSERVELKNQ